MSEENRKAAETDRREQQERDSRKTAMDQQEQEGMRSREDEKDSRKGNRKAKKLKGARQRKLAVPNSGGARCASGCGSRKLRSTQREKG